MPMSLPKSDIREMAFDSLASYEAAPPMPISMAIAEVCFFIKSLK